MTLTRFKKLLQFNGRCFIRDKGFWVFDGKRIEIFRESFGKTWPSILGHPWRVKIYHFSMFTFMASFFSEKSPWPYCILLCFFLINVTLINLGSDLAKTDGTVYSYQIFYSLVNICESVFKNWYACKKNLAFNLIYYY